MCLIRHWAYLIKELANKYLPNKCLPNKFLPNKCLPNKFLPNKDLPNKYLPASIIRQNKNRIVLDRARERKNKAHACAGAAVKQIIKHAKGKCDALPPSTRAEKKEKKQSECNGKRYMAIWHSAYSLPCNNKACAARRLAFCAACARFINSLALFVGAGWVRAIRLQPSRRKA